MPCETVMEKVRRLRDMRDSLPPQPQGDSCRIDEMTPVFLLSDLPNMATHCSQESCGFSLYRGVLVQWDEDRDNRVFTLIDNMPEDEREILLVVQEHEGCVAFVWSCPPPPKYDTGNQIEVESDLWSITDSRVAKMKRLNEDL